MAKPTLSAQVATLTEQVAAVIARLDRLERERAQPFRWPGWHTTPPEPDLSQLTTLATMDYAQLSERFRFFTTAILMLTRGYYLGFGMLYTLAGFAGIITTLTHPANLLPPVLALVIDLLVLLVGCSNLSCLRVRAERWQRGVAIPTILTAALILILQTVLAILTHSVLNVIIAPPLWGTFVVIHVGILRYLSGRIGLTRFTEAFGAAASAMNDQPAPTSNAEATPP